MENFDPVKHHSYFISLWMTNLLLDPNSPVKKVKEKAAGAAKKAAATTAAAAKKSAKPEPRSPIKVKLPPLKHKKNDPPTSEPSEPAPEPSEPAPEPSEPALEASEPAPEPSEPAPEASEPAPEPSKTTPEPSEPAPEPSKQTPESPASPTVRIRITHCQISLVFFDFTLLSKIGPLFGMDAEP